ncbi:Amidase [Dictyocaulus viviparus]|uniref:Amidase n=1 Tax=Dictyocaulus viviparus TaxID=29172 RepID=A0A0D8Y3H0_DICVI|nr:Amidase [Dictyocaulus viviparus]
MEAAGAILLAITNVPEACYWVETSNGIYGQTKNPYDLRRSVGGSSGGEGALISSAGSVIGIGSDIGGSIRIPAFMNGIFGMINTPGVISQDGHVIVAKGYQKKMLRIGPMCRYVEDIPLLVEVMGGDQVVSLNLRDAVDFGKIRLFYMEGIQNTFTIETLSDDMRSSLMKAVAHFEQKYDVEGIRIDLPLMSKAVEMLFVSMQIEGEPKCSQYLKSLKADKGSLNWFSELPKFLTGRSVHTLGALFISFFESVDNRTKNEKTELLRLRNRLTRQIEEILGDNGILLFPSWPHTAPYHHHNVFTPFDVAYTSVFSALALPVIQCPMGLNANGLPLGIQIIGTPNSDRLLIAAAKEISDRFGGWIQASGR